MGVMDTAGNLVTLGVAYKTDNLMTKERRSCKKKRK